MPKCRRCKSDNIRRSHARTMWERFRKEITHKRLYRCHACGWRGWDADPGPPFGKAEEDIATRAVPEPPPDLEDMRVRSDGRRAEINLDELDALDPPGPQRTRRS